MNIFNDERKIRCIRNIAATTKKKDRNKMIIKELSYDLYNDFLDQLDFFENNLKSNKNSFFNKQLGMTDIDQNLIIQGYFLSAELLNNFTKYFINTYKVKNFFQAIPLEIKTEQDKIKCLFGDKSEN